VAAQPYQTKGLYFLSMSAGSGSAMRHRNPSFGSKTRIAVMAHRPTTAGMFKLEDAGGRRYAQHFRRSARPKA
jgi:hypothetical protein